jgi:hypothetical protein
LRAELAEVGIFIGGGRPKDAIDVGEFRKKYVWLKHSRLESGKNRRLGDAVM